jgi:hypothetical protein
VKQPDERESRSADGDSDRCGEEGSKREFRDYFHGVLPGVVGTRAFQQSKMRRAEPETGGVTINCGELMAALFPGISSRGAPVY